MKIQIKNFLIAFLIYATSIAQSPQSMLYGLIFLIGLYYSIEAIARKKLTKSDLILISFILLTVILFTVGKMINKNIDFIFLDVERSKDVYPYTIILWGTIFFSKKINLEVFKYLLYFICFEACIVLIEFFLGIQYIIDPKVQEAETKFGSTDLLYFNRVFGLSPNVSILGIKLLVGVVLLFFLNHWEYMKRYRVLVFTLLVAAAVFSFQRTAILAIIFFIFLYLFSYFRKIKFIYKLLIIFTIASVVFTLMLNIDYIIFQFTRGKSTDFTDIRAIIFGVYINYIQNNIFWGNFSEKIFIMLAGHSYHSHNSFLQMIATVGIPAFLVWLLYLKNIINKTSLIFILPFFLYSMTQYGVFWGCSLFDIVMYGIIFQAQNAYD